MEKDWFCDICGEPIKVHICCNSFDCGCMGLPTEPPFCSNECYDKFINKKEYEARSK